MYTYTKFIIYIFFSFLTQKVSFSDPDPGFGGCWIASVVEPTIIEYSITGMEKSQLNVIYFLIYMYLIAVAIPALIFSLGLFIYIWKDPVEKWVLFFINKIPDGRIKDWLKKKIRYNTKYG